MIASVATASQKEILDFPAHDVVQHKCLTTFRRHYTVIGGMDKVQAKLVQGQKIHFSSRVIAVTPLNNTTRVT
jgi:hypothetical protein